MKKTASIDATGSSSSEYYERTSHSGSLSVEDENSDITIENGTEDIDDYIEDSLSNMCDTTIDNDSVIVDVNQSVQGQLRALSFDLSLDVATSVSSADCVTPTPQSEASKPSTSAAAAAAEAAAALTPCASASVADTAPFHVAERRHHASTSSSSSSLLVSESQRLQRAAAAVYNYRSSVQLSTEHEYAYINDIYSEDDEKVYEDLCYVTFQSKVKPEVCSLHSLSHCHSFSSHLLHLQLQLYNLYITYTYSPQPQIHQLLVPTRLDSARTRIRVRVCVYICVCVCFATFQPHNTTAKIPYTHLVPSHPNRLQNYRTYHRPLVSI